MMENFPSNFIFKAQIWKKDFAFSMFAWLYPITWKANQNSSPIPNSS
jgi:hypothetical protein